jgi:RNase adapter protein RapZ
MNKTPFVLVSGMSGAGKTFALKILENIGYAATDNLPITLIDRLIHPDRPLDHPIALGIDIRTQDFGSKDFIDLIKNCKKDLSLHTQVLFLDCDDDTLSLRYNESRRRHPLAQDHPVIDGIRLERRLLEPMQQLADLVIDTTSLAVPDLRRILRAHFDLDAGPSTLFIQIMSFSYRFGIPREADMVFDMRFLDNPHYEDHLGKKTGKDKVVSDFIELDQDSHIFLHHCKAILNTALPRFQSEGRHYLTIAFGCTGGQHRSVYMAETIYSFIQQIYPHTKIHHRNMIEE